MLRLLLVFILFSIGLMVAAQPTLTESEAIQVGLQNNFSIKIAETDVDIAENLNDWAIAGRYPTIDFNLNSNNAYNRSNNPASFLIKQNALSTQFSPNVELNWTLFNGHRVEIAKDQLEKQLELTQSNLQVAVENSIADIVSAYYAALVEREELAVREEVLALSRDRVEYQELRREYGQAGTFDVLQSQDAYLNDSTSYLNQVTVYRNALRNLNSAMGVEDLDAQYELTDQLEDFQPEAYELETLEQRMLADNKNLQTLYLNQQLAAISTQLQKTTLQPIIGLRTGATYNINLSSGTQAFRGGGEGDIPEVAAKTLNGYIALTATYRLFDGGVRQRNIETARLEERIAQLNIDDLKLQIRTQLENTLATYRTQKELVSVTTQLVANARRNLEISEERFRGGLVNSFDYRTIQLQFISANQARLDAIFNLKLTETELIRLIGGFTR